MSKKVRKDQWNREQGKDWKNKKVISIEVDGWFLGLIDLLMTLIIGKSFWY